MSFIPGPRTFPVVVPDGMGGQYDEGSLPLTLLEATGIYRAFAGGHNNMVDKLHQLVAGAPFAGFPASGYDALCFCMIFQRSIPSFSYGPLEPNGIHAYRAGAAPNAGGRPVV